MASDLIPWFAEIAAANGAEAVIGSVDERSEGRCEKLAPHSRHHLKYQLHETCSAGLYRFRRGAS